MSSDAARFIGNIPEHHDTGLGPVIFVDYAADIARRVAACNPTRVLETDAIAVYASQPLSPVATQHSLPSGRYSLLGPDLHRLDRTSFAWRTLLDHFVGAGEQRRRHLDAQRPGGFEIDD
jgi:hypothetical protein